MKKLTMRKPRLAGFFFRYPSISGFSLTVLSIQNDLLNSQVQIQDGEIRKLEEALEKSRSKEDGYCAQIKNAQVHSNKSV